MTRTPSVAVPSLKTKPCCSAMPCHNSCHCSYPDASSPGMLFSVLHIKSCRGMFDTAFYHWSCKSTDVTMQMCIKID